MNTNNYIDSYKFCNNNNNNESSISRLEIMKQIARRYGARIKKDLKGGISDNIIKNYFS